jgi:protein-S-isoprenylcysteine O-methyltransferase Ste14
MSTAAMTVALANFIYIGLLPIIFFRSDGSLNLMWWATATPFVVAGAAVLAAYVGLLQSPLELSQSAQLGSEVVGVLIHLGSIALIAYTLGTHRRAIALWHQNNDSPQHVVTEGAYRLARHPFYSAFLLAFFAACLLFPHVLTLALFGYAVLILNHTAKREEQRFVASDLGEEYAEFMKRTNRFWPGWQRNRG